MLKGYLIFTTHDGDELDATLVQDKFLFDALCGAAYDNDAAMILWSNYCNENADQEQMLETHKFFAQAPGNYKWPFNGVEVLGTFYLCVY